MDSLKEKFMLYPPHTPKAVNCSKWIVFLACCSTGSSSRWYQPAAVPLESQFGLQRMFVSAVLSSFKAKTHTDFSVLMTNRSLCGVVLSDKHL
ncbi:hypothetical protein OJAV_G00219520 [Oryzias javanicus]|uniref:Uncharacterized protein n=1 Tax=Oryzias javanicus TaxID=123683 RepID=A0A437C0M6_ORYJA|nr:hypothetical protein OJAV_G00219520 [Oryzias javanicus]